MGRKNMVNFYVDPEDWKRFGDKVGLRGRAESLRNAIREIIAIPDSVVEMKQEQSNHIAMAEMYESKIQEKNKAHQEKIKQVDESLTLEEQAKAGLKEAWESHPVTRMVMGKDKDGLRGRVEENYYAIIDDDIQYWANYGEVDLIKMREWVKSHKNVKIDDNYEGKMNERERSPVGPDKLLDHD